MLEAITWKEYLMGTGIIALGYYATIVFIYYKNDVRTLLTSGNLKKAGKEGKVDRSEEDLENPLEALEKVVSDIRCILERAGKNAVKAEILEETSSLLQNYPGFREPAHRVAIRNFIIQHAEYICQIEFTDEELDGAWLRMEQRDRNSGD